MSNTFEILPGAEGNTYMYFAADFNYAQNNTSHMLINTSKDFGSHVWFYRPPLCHLHDLFEYNCTILLRYVSSKGELSWIFIMHNCITWHLLQLYSNNKNTWLNMDTVYVLTSYII